jgi:hypothetical protein
LNSFFFRSQRELAFLRREVEMFHEGDLTGKLGDGCDPCIAQSLDLAPGNR